MRELYWLFLILLGTGAVAQPNRYSYQLELNDSLHLLTGSVSIHFKNTSRDSLPGVYVHLPPRSLEFRSSLLQKQFVEFQSVDLYYAPLEERGYIKVSNLAVNNVPLPEMLDSCCKECEFIFLPITSMLGDSVQIELDFEIKIPDARFNGTGFDGKVYRIVDWLPRLATLDSSGWHQSAVTYQNDIYQNFDEFDVRLTLDDEFIAAGNARLMSEKEQAQYREMEDELFRPLKATTGTKKTLHFHHSGTTSLQFFISRNFYISRANDKVRLFYTEKDPFVNYILPETDKKINNFFEKEIGEGFTQEYDLVLLESKKKGEFQSDRLLSLDHPSKAFEFNVELAHARAQQLFRYETGPNGVKDAWFSRGLPYYYKYRFVKEEYPDKKWLPLSNSFLGRFFELDQFNYDYQNQFLYLYLARQGLDQSMATSADSLSRLNYEAITQGKTYLALSHLEEYVGEREFKRAMRKFYLENKGTPTSPEDLRKSLQYYYFGDVNWFFEELVPSSSSYNYKIIGADHCPTVSTATIKNTGHLNIPYSLTGIKNDSVVLTEWHAGHSGTKSVQMYHADYDKVVVNHHRVVPEFSQKDNTIKTKGLLKQLEPLRIQLLYSFENPEKTQLYWMPTANYNAYDKLLLGISLYNDGPLIDKPFEFLIGPEYSFGTGQLTGYLTGLFNIIPEGGPFYKISAGLFTRYYHYDQDLAYLRISPSASFYFRRKYRESSILSKLRIRAVSLRREMPGNFDGLANSVTNASYTVLNANYSLEDIHVLHPFSLQFDFQYGDQFSRATAEADFRWMLPNKRWLIWRSFGGIFFNNKFSNMGINGNYYSLGLSGTQDYLFDYTFIGRSDRTGIWSQQFFTTDGGFKSQTNVYSDKYMLTTNLSIPVWTAFGLFGDAGIVDGFDRFYWDYGVRVAIFTDFLELYFPFQNQDRNFLGESAYYENIRYVLNIDIGKIVERIRRGYY